jgi:hypothetical protein
VKALKSKEDYCNNPTSFERFAAEILRFSPASGILSPLALVVRFERDIKRPATLISR